MMSIKRYLLGAIIAFVVILIVSLLLGSQLSGWLEGVRGQAGNLATLAGLFIDPIVWVLRNGVLGALAAALLWPMLVFVLIGAFVFVIIIVGFPAAGGALNSGNRPNFP